MSAVQISLEKNLKQFEKKQMIVSFLGLIILLGVSIIANQLFRQSAAEQTGKLIKRMMNTSDFREVTLTLNEANLDYFHKIQIKSKSLNIFETFPPIAEHEKPSLLNAVVYEKIYLDLPSVLTVSDDDKILFEFNRFSFFPYAILIWLVLNLVSIPQTRYIKNRIEKQFEKDLQLQTRSAEVAISRKVRHNINTPLAALIAMTDRLQRLETKDQDLFESIVQQIRSLVKDLDDAERKNRDSDSSQTPLIVSENEKPRLAYQAIKESFYEVKAAFSDKYAIESDLAMSLLSAKVSFVSHEFRSIIGNLVKNAAEASTRGQKILIQTKDLSNMLEIKVQDFGKGIPKEMINKVTEKGISHDKPGGTGFGLHHAKTCVEAWGGSLLIESTEGSGTTVIILLPIAERANWFTPRLKIRSNQTVVILDDQKSQHILWKIKLDENDFQGPIKMFNSSKDYLDFMNKAVTESSIADYVFFFDYDLGDAEPRGLDLLKAIPGTAQRYLVTGHSDDLTIQGICDQERIFLIPKTELPELPLVTIAV